MRGKVAVFPPDVVAPGITPACAGKSRSRPNSSPRSGDHPRMCGEKDMAHMDAASGAGSPPHVRGKVVGCVKLCLVLGITPACAGKSRQEKFSKLPGEDHPRMCGEKHHLVNDIGHIGGSPPHVRGKAAHDQIRVLVLGITPACAGKRLAYQKDIQGNRDHPRMCGEKEARQWPKEQVWGSPPHVRGKVAVSAPAFHWYRITPACAGKSC